MRGDEWIARQLGQRDALFCREAVVGGQGNPQVFFAERPARHIFRHVGIGQPHDTRIEISCGDLRDLLVEVHEAQRQHRFGRTCAIVTDKLRQHPVEGRRADIAKRQFPHHAAPGAKCDVFRSPGLSQNGARFGQDQRTGRRKTHPSAVPIKEHGADDFFHLLQLKRELRLRDVQPHRRMAKVQFLCQNDKKFVVFEREHVSFSRCYQKDR